MSRTKKALSYVLGDISEKENHILPINAMQYSRFRNQLYSAGRDGTVKVWNALPGSPSGGAPEPAAYEDSQDMDEMLLKLETSISSSPLSHREPAHVFDTAGGINYNVHFDWINDLKLVNNDRHIVSASADLSMKLIDLECSQFSFSKFSTIHTDYIKKLSSIPSKNSLVSGGLDGLVVLWDLQSLKPVQSFLNGTTTAGLPGSIYALSNDNGNVVATGGPNNVVNLYDTRIDSSANSNLIRRLVGHQDNVRCLLMNSNYILSGSADTSVKLWDMRNFNVYKNFEHNDDAVWSLCTAVSSDPYSQSSSIADFKEFYSGNKAGEIIKTDINYLSTHSEYDEEDPFGANTFSSSDSAFIDEKLGLCTLVARADSPIVSLCLEGDASVFASTYSSLHRYHIPQTRQLANYQYVRTCVDYIRTMDSKFDENLSNGVEASLANQSDLNSDFYDIVSHLSMDSTNIDLPHSVSVISLGANHDPETSESDAEYVSMFLNVNGGSSFEFVNAFKDPVQSFSDTVSGEFVDSTPIEMLLYPVPSSQIVTIPFNKKPFQDFKLTPKSIIAKRMLNNKRQVMALYADGEISIWDLFICKEVKKFPQGNNKEALSSEELKIRMGELDTLLEQHQTNEILNNWCEVDIRAGHLLVTIGESFFNNVEIHYDELLRDYPYLDSRLNQLYQPKNHLVGPDDRFWLARIFLNSIFYQYMIYESDADRLLREQLKAAAAKQKSASNSPESSTEVDDTPKRGKLFSRMSSKASIPQLKSSINSSPTEKTDVGDPSQYSVSIEGASSVSDDSVYKSLTQIYQLYKEKYRVEGSKKTLDSILKPYWDYNAANMVDEYRPLIPEKHLPKDLLIIVVESSPELGNYRDLCSFRLGEIFALKSAEFTKQNQLVNQIRTFLPKWIGYTILYNRFPAKEMPKIAFQLLEMEYGDLPPEKKIGGKSQRKIKKLPMLDGSIKLTSHSMLRVSKILNYLTDKFDSRTSEMKSKKSPGEWLVLECRGQELENSMTLQTIKTLIWKSNTDIELYFRRRFDPCGPP